MTNISKTLSVVIPVYFNAESLPGLFDELRDLEKALAADGLDLELIFVDDGSRDNSFGRLVKIKEERPATKLIRLARNFGAVAASKTGLRYVTGDAFTILSADLQDPASQLHLMAQEWQKGAKFVVSIRASRGDPLSTRAFAWFYYQVLEAFVLKGYPKGGYDLMLMDKCMLHTMSNSPKHTNPNVYAWWHGFPAKKLTYHRRPRRHGRSRWTVRKKLKFFVDTVSGFSAVPLRIMALFGLTVSSISFLYGFYVVVNALLGRYDVQGFATIVALISFFFGLVMVMLGMIGEYLWRIFEGVNSKPEAVVDIERL